MDWLSTIVGSLVGTIVTLIGALFIPPIRRWWRYRNSTVRDAPQGCRQKLPTAGLPVP